ncbi:MAG TPA: hypothetical protein VGF68_09985 [Solirubrobacteraceae bacterium]
MLHRFTRALALGALIGGIGAATARADYNVINCGGSPAPAWFEGLDSSAGFAAASDGCTTGGAYGFDIAGTSMTPNTDVGVGLRAPSGLAFTHVTVHYDTIPTSAGAEAFMRIEHDGSLMIDALMGNATAGTDLSAGLPDTRDITFNVYCSSSDGSVPCSFTSTNILTLGAMTLTLHDTGQPTVSATGGNLAVAGAYAGVQTLSFSAADAGSGVDHVTVALGATVLAAAQSVCQTFNLSPCPSTAAGTLDVDTTRVPDGTYPVTLTAYDASGDATPVQVSTITVANHQATQVLPPPTKAGSVHTQVEMHWRWYPTRTVLTHLVVRRFARSATITVRCEGRRCPFKVTRGDGRHVRRFVKAMVGRVFHSGQKLTVVIAQPRRRAERGQIAIRRNRKPLAKPL